MTQMSTNSHEYFVVTFSYIAYLFYIYQTCIFCNSHEIHFGTTRNFFL
jgi:hypothetical protein